MKGVIASRTEVPVVDLTHEIEPFDVFGAAWFLRDVVRWWPAGTLFVCVVDPGVGTARKIVAAEDGGRIFLAPDNGLLTFVAGAGHAVTNEGFFLPKGSTTFHGRDRFAPVAAAIANGVPLAELGPRLEALVALAYEAPSYGEVVRGTVVAVDRFGNAITDIEAARVPSSRFALHVGEKMIDHVEMNYGDAAAGPFLIVGSGGCIEISVANGSAADELQLRGLQRVELRPL